MISSQWESRLFNCFGAICHDIGCQLRCTNGVEDHVHLLVQAPPTLCVSDLVKRLKGSSSHFVSHELGLGEQFRWQGYYGAFSVSGSNLKRVESYIACQKERHREQKLWGDAERIWLPDSFSDSE